MIGLSVFAFVVAFVLLLVGEIRQKRALRIAGLVLLAPGIIMIAFMLIFMSLYAG